MKDSKNLFFFLTFIFFLYLKKIDSSELDEISPHLLLKFKKEIKNENKMMTQDSYMRELMYKQLYSKFDVGIPSQRIKFYFEINHYESTITEDDYETKRSTTYKLLETNETNKANDSKANKRDYLSQEVLIFNKEKKLENFTFLLKGKSIPDKVENTNIFGLNLIPNNKTYINNINKSLSNISLSFLENLKQNNFIDKKIFSFLFGDYVIMDNLGFDGQILIGCYPHEINSLFKEKDLKWISIKDNKNASSRKWYINFDVVKFNKDELKDKYVDLDISLNLIVGPESFRQKLLTDFFKKNIENKNCKENFFYSVRDEQHYIFYSCSYQTEFIDIPILSFYNKQINESFKFVFSDLFSNYKHRFYFNIIFNKNPQNHWIFGQLFFNTYRFVFDLDEEKIGYYKTYPYKDSPITVFICFIIAIIVFVIGYLSGYMPKIGIDNNTNVYQVLNPIRNEYERVPSTEDYNNNNNKDEKKDNNKNKLKEKEKKIKQN